MCLLFADFSWTADKGLIFSYHNFGIFSINIILRYWIWILQFCNLYFSQFVVISVETGCCFETKRSEGPF